MALFKTDLGVAERYLRLVDEDIARALLAATSSPSTRASSSACWRSPARTGCWTRRPRCRRRLEHRNPWIDPLSHLQVELLRRLRAGRDEARAPLLATITGIAAGMRNTG